ncbi:MAG: hypothetical protein HY465_03385 [Deltaproteobacteria bacterium]|nr:hypothetical protein [Deltaproteobacteria bacterium]
MVVGVSAVFAGCQKAVEAPAAMEQVAPEAAAPAADAAPAEAAPAEGTTTQSN